MQKSVFTVEGDTNAYIGYTDGRKWKLYSMPYFPYAEAVKIAEELNINAEYPMQYDEIYDQFYIMGEEFEKWQGITDVGIKLYPIGAGSWLWEDMDTPNYRRQFAQDIEEFIFYHDTYNYRDEYGIEREETMKQIIAQLHDINIYAEAITIMQREELTADEKFEQLGKILTL